MIGLESDEKHWIFKTNFSLAGNLVCCATSMPVVVYQVAIDNIISNSFF